MTDIPETPKTKAPTHCVVCLKPLPESEAKEHDQTMYNRPKFTCSNKCFNLYWLSDRPVGDGWMPIIWDLHNKLNKLYPDYRIEQIKEKFGGLRYYVSGVPYYTEEATKRAEELLAAAKENREPEPWAEIQSEVREDDYTEGYKLINEAERRASVTCERCGEPGESRSDSWIKTLCGDCHDERERERAERAAEWERQKKEREDGPTQAGS